MRKIERFQRVIAKKKSWTENLLNKLQAKCSSYKTWTACGYEYDCRAHENIDCCENCLACYGSIHPETGKKHKIRGFFVARLFNIVENRK